MDIKNRTIRGKVGISSSLLAASVAFWLAMGCSDPGSSFGEGNKESRATKSEKAEAASLESAEDERGDVPQEVSGAFLTCAMISAVETPLEVGSNHDPIGCAIKKDHQKIDRTELELQMTAYDRRSARIAMTTKMAALGSDWHIFGALPKTADNQGLIRVSARRKGAAQAVQYEFPIKGLGRAPTAGDAPAGTPTELRLNAKSGTWAMGQGLGSAVGGVQPAAVCDKGEARTQLNHDANTLDTLGKILGGAGLFETKIDRTPRTLTDSCFAVLTIIDRDNTPIAKDLALEGEGCLFMQLDDVQKSVLIISKEDALAQGLTKEKLIAFAKSRKSCP